MMLKDYQNEHKVIGADSRHILYLMGSSQNKAGKAQHQPPRNLQSRHK